MIFLIVGSCAALDFLEYRLPFLISHVRRCCLAAILACCAGGAFSQSKLPSLASFFDNAQFASPALSPNGKLLAVITGTPGKRDGLTVIDLASKQVYSAARFADVDIASFRWVNEQRLVFDTGDKLLAPSERRYGAGLYAVNYDGSKPLQLVSRSGQPPAQHVQPFYTHLYRQTGLQDSDSVYVTRVKNNGRSSQRELLTLNTLNGDAKRVEVPDGTMNWIFDHQGALRMTGMRDDERVTFRYRDSGAGAWRDLPNVNAATVKETQLLGFGPQGTLYVEAANGKDKLAVYTLDIASGKLADQPLIATADYDFAGRLIMSRDRLLGFHVTTDAESTIWIDPAMKALQDEIDQRLDSTVNMLSVPVRPETPWVLVVSYSDLRPKTILVYNTASKAFIKIGDSHPEIRPEQMGRQETVHYKARDGRDIPALLTLPAGRKSAQLPMVVLVHGGPWVRGNTWGWRPDSQFLASRGYAVLEPSFRGSTGLGKAHFKAGMKQWGLAMQDDLADGARWAIAQGMVDPKRICIAGASYGGYATLMGLAKDPDLYKCGIDWVGVTDINLLYENHWGYESDASDRTLSHTLPEMVGDRVKDAAQLQAASPLEQAARIRQPLLMAYGGVDKRVPLFHGIKFRDAVKKTNQDVEWVVYPEEGHGWTLAQNRIDFWSRVEKFLDRNIGK